MSKLAKKKKNQKKAKKRKGDNEIKSHTNKIKAKIKYRKKNQKKVHFEKNF